MSHKVDEIKVTTLKEVIEVERERLKKLRNDRPEWWEHSSDWARREFGENLDGAVTDLTIHYNAKKCNICGKELEIDEKFLLLKLNLCDECGCTMAICKPCLKNLWTILRT